MHQSSLLRTDLEKRKQRVDQVWWGLNRGFTPEGDKPEKQIKQTKAKKQPKEERQTPIISSQVESPVCWKGESPL